MEIKERMLEVAIESVVRGYLIKSQGCVLTVPICIELSEEITETIMQVIESDKAKSLRVERTRM